MTSSADLPRVEAYASRLREEAPLVADHSVDVVVSDCVLNLVRSEDKPHLFHEIHRVLRRGGRAVISDIVSDQDVPLRLQNDPDLWAGCVSGALREDRFLEAFEEAGFYGMTLLERPGAPWRTVEGIEFRSVTVVAYKGKEGACSDHEQAVVYKGPFREVTDDDGHVLRRGVRVAVCDKTFNLYRRAPYAEHFAFVEPPQAVPHEAAPRDEETLARDRAGTSGDATTTGPDDGCGPGCCC